jgi:hypothetical protein
LLCLSVFSGRTEFGQILADFLFFSFRADDDNESQGESNRSAEALVEVDGFGVHVSKAVVFFAGRGGLEEWR